MEYGRVWMQGAGFDEFSSFELDPGSGFILVEPGSIGRGLYFVCVLYKINVARVKQLLF